MNTPVGASKGPIKVQGKEYKLKDVNADTLTAEAVRTSASVLVPITLELTRSRFCLRRTVRLSLRQ